MTRNDYQVIAKVLADLYSDFNNGGSDEISLSLVIQELAWALGEEDSQFNRDRFVKACGLQEGQ